MNQKPIQPSSLSYSPLICLDRAMRPTREHLELTMLAFLALAPLGYWVMTTLFAVIG